MPGQWPCAGATRVGGDFRWKSQNRKNVYLSPFVEEPFNSKVIKSFVPELRNRKCFSCFEIPMFYVYMLWIFYVRFTYPYHEYGTITDIKFGNQLKSISNDNYVYLSQSFVLCWFHSLLVWFKVISNSALFPKWRILFVLLAFYIQGCLAKGQNSEYHGDSWLACTLSKVSYYLDLSSFLNV